MTTKFRPSIIHSASVSDIEMVINELFEDMEDKITQYEQSFESLRSEGYEDLACEFRGKIIALLEMKLHLQEYQRKKYNSRVANKQG